MILAHGIGGRDDLPLPLDLVIQGAGVALLVSFLALGLLWRTPKFGNERGRPISQRWQEFLDSRPLRIGLRVAMLMLAIRFVGAPYAVYAVFWVGLAFASVVCGPVWRVLNPLRLLFAVRRTAARRHRYPHGLGYWPAAAGLFAFVWLELAAPHNDSPWVLIGFFSAHTVVQLAGAMRYGPVWFERADPFELYSSLLGRLSFLARRDDRRLVLRNPFDSLAVVPALPGLIAVVCVCLGSTAFDSVRESVIYIGTVQRFDIPAVFAATVGLVCVIALMAGAFALATKGFGDSRRLAATLVPIVAGYVVAHYYSLLARGIGDWMTGVSTVAAIQVTAVILGHIIGVVAAHDRALAVLPPNRRLAGQAPLLFLMVGYTTGGLTLLFAS